MEYTDVLLIGVILGLVELFKFLDIPKKVLPLLSIALGPCWRYFLHPHRRFKSGHLNWYNHGTCGKWIL